MNTLLRTNREIREIDDRQLRYREQQIQKIMYSYGYDRENAEKINEINKIRSVELMWGAFCGGFAVFKTRPIRAEMAKSYGIFRKSWMRYPIPAVIFGAAYTVGTMLPQRFGRKLSFDPTVTHDTYTSSTDLVGRFRLFSNDDNRDSSESQIAAYLSTYSAEALTEPEIIANLEKASSKLSEKEANKWQIKRTGKDADDMYWMMGKIHGLENIAFLTEEEIEQTNGNPVALQILINNLKIPKGEPSSFEQQLTLYKNRLDKYKEQVDKLNLTSSDRKKLLALPFHLQKRQELPEPRKGQAEYELFEYIYGMRWYDDAFVARDQEEKITEFNYEKFIPSEILKTLDTTSEDFKLYIKMLNFTSNTKYEQLQKNKEEFRKLMPLLAQLNLNEKLSLIHLLQNQSQKSLYLDQLTNNQLEIQLAKISEKENYAVKNRYRHNAQTMDFAEAKRMPIDERKVKDLLRNQHIFRDKFNTEIGTYQQELDNPMMQNGVLNYLNEAAYGEMKDLINDVGINSGSIPFYNTKELYKFKEDQSYDSDNHMHYLMNAMFTPLDMTDHEEAFVGWNEIGGQLPINRVSWLGQLKAEKHPMSKKLVGMETLEKRPIRMTSATYQGIISERYTDKEEEENEEQEYDDEVDENDSSEEEGEEEYGAEDYGEEEPEVQSTYDPVEIQLENRFFVGDKQRGHSLRDNYSDVEIGAFMKVLNVKPHKQWEDQTTHHYKLGVHDYEDEAQELDPIFHTLSEQEREAAERQKTYEWRSGQEIRFQVGDKQPLRYDYRF